jgi:tRNA (guanine37-N1)-methyltransferase
MKSKALRVDFLTLFPELFPGYLNASILGRAQKAGLLEAKAHQLREWAVDDYGHVDDRPFGGGAGMVMMIEPFHRALMALKLRKKDGTPTAQAKKTRVILTSAKGKLFTQEDAVRLSQYDRLVFLCGRYEGVDERVATHLIDEELSIGPYVMTGGELASLVMLDAAVRLRPGVLGKEASLQEESWSDGETREYPQFTRPEEYQGWSVPPILLSGNHAAITAWRHGLMRGPDESSIVSSLRPPRSRSKKR